MGGFKYVIQGIVPNPFAIIEKFQVVKEYYELEGFLTNSNIKGPRNKEIDLLAIRYEETLQDYVVIWAEVKGSGKVSRGKLSIEEIVRKFPPELEEIATEKTGKQPKKIFYTFYLPEKGIIERVIKEYKILIKPLQQPIEALVNRARENVTRRRFPYSPACPIRSLLQALVEWNITL